MSYILYIALALLVPASSSAERPYRHRPREWKLKPRVDLTSSARIAKLISQLAKGETQNGIDMDYFGGSGERIEHNKRSEDRRSQSGERYYYPKNRVRLVYVSNPEVLEEYKKKLKKIRVERGSSSESGTDEEGVSYLDILKFLIQVDARLRERAGRPRNTLPILSPTKFNSVFQNLRRQINRQSDESSIDGKPIARMRENYESKENDEYRGHQFSMIKDKPSEPRNKGIYESKSVEDDGKRKKVSSEERGWNKREKTRESRSKMKTQTLERPRKREAKNSIVQYNQRDAWEPANKVASWGHNSERFRPRPKDKGRLPNFISTPIPPSGRQGIYEDDK